MDFLKNVFWIAFQIKMTANYQIVLKNINFNGTPHSRAIFQKRLEVLYKISIFQLQSIWKIIFRKFLRRSSAVQTEPS